MKIRITGKSLAKAQLAGGVKKFNTTGQFGSLGNNGFGTLNNAFTNQFSSAATPTNNSFFGSNPKPLFNTSAAMNTMPNFNPDGTAPDVNDRWHDPNFVNYAALLKNSKGITRRTIKQTVMTSVYGVTLIGARDQIEKQLREFNIVDKENIGRVSMYLAKITIESIGDLFKEANQIKSWLTKCALIISQSGNTVKWITPLG